MTVDFVDTTLVTIALDRVSGDPFEAFAQEFFSAMRGTDYVPLGGMHDGGAEGYVSKIELAAGKPKHFMQASVQQDFRKKIRATVKRLRQKGRDPEALTYLTSLVIRSIDDEESALGKELGVSLRIRDRNYIANHINDGPRTRASYWHHLESELAFLKSAGKAPILAHSEHVTSPEVFVFLRQELERREGNASLLDAVIDSLALYALEGTDPDKGVLRPIDEVRARIVEAIPSAEQIVSVAAYRQWRVKTTLAVVRCGGIKRRTSTRSRMKRESGWNRKTLKTLRCRSRSGMGSSRAWRNGSTVNLTRRGPVAAPISA